MISDLLMVLFLTTFAVCYPSYYGKSCGFLYSSSISYPYYPYYRTQDYYGGYNGYGNYGAYGRSAKYYYPSYQTSPSYQTFGPYTPVVGGGANSIYPGYGGWINPLGTGSGWAAGGGLVGNAISFFAGK